MESCSALCCSAAASRFSSSNLGKRVSHSGAQDAERLTSSAPHPVLSDNDASEFKSLREVILTFPHAAQHFFETLPHGPTAPSGPFPALFPQGLPCVAAQSPLAFPHLSAGLQHTRWNNHTVSITLLLQLQRAPRPLCQGDEFLPSNWSCSESLSRSSSPLERVHSSLMEVTSSLCECFRLSIWGDRNIPTVPDPHVAPPCLLHRVEMRHVRVTYLAAQRRDLPLGSVQPPRQLAALLVAQLKLFFRSFQLQPQGLPLRLLYNQSKVKKSST